MNEGSTPITIIGGYLGAGKTTYINQHLQSRQDQCGLAILVNDFGEVNIDAALIQQRSPDGKVIGLSNGCVCCSIQDDFAATLEMLHDLEIHEVLMEASGVALPGKLRLQCAYPGYHAERVRVLVDACAYDRLSKDKYVGHLVRQQIAQADELIITKTDLNSDFMLPADALSAPEQDTSVFTSVTLQQQQAISRPQLQNLLRTLPAWVQRVKGFVTLADGEVALAQCVGTDFRLEPGLRDAPAHLVMIAPAQYERELSELAQRYCEAGWQHTSGSH